MRGRRLALITLVALGLAPGTWLRTPRPPRNLTHELRIVPVPAPDRRFGPLRLMGAWQLSSRNSLFGGYSALLALPDGRLLAGSDRGEMLIFSPPGGPAAPFEFASFGRFDGDPWGLNDLEALTRDPHSGRIWAAFESNNRILGLDADFGNRRLVAPRAMSRWRGDFGPEAMVRLADGRFIVLAEQGPSWFASTSPGLLFPHDPVESEAPAKFRLARPDGYSPTDMAQLPDGRVILLLRHFRLGVPPHYPGKIAIADLATLRDGGIWRSATVAELDEPVPSDNYEGIAVQPGAEGGAVVWVISDDNRSTLQRTLLLKFLWAPTQKAPGSSGRP